MTSAKLESREEGKNGIDQRDYVIQRVGFTVPRRYALFEDFYDGYIIGTTDTFKIDGFYVLWYLPNTGTAHWKSEKEVFGVDQDPVRTEHRLQEKLKEEAAKMDPRNRWLYTTKSSRSHTTTMWMNVFGKIVEVELKPEDRIKERYSSIRQALSDKSYRGRRMRKGDSIEITTGMWDRAEPTLTLLRNEGSDIVLMSEYDSWPKIPEGERTPEEIKAGMLCRETRSKKEIVIKPGQAMDTEDIEGWVYYLD